VPAVVKIWVTFLAEATLVLDQLPSPKLQFHIVGVPVEVSVNWTARGNVPDETLVMKDAVSNGGEVTTIVFPDEVELFTASETTRYAV
jgi:hypothetical protein